MLMYDDTQLNPQTGGGPLCRPAGKRQITHVFHDIDGTHSLIREWQPVMSTLLAHVIAVGLPDGFDSEPVLAELVEKCPALSTPETDRFCIESAGLSALTQMEWAIRRAIDAQSIAPQTLGLARQDLALNKQIIDCIWDGEESFEDWQEPIQLKRYLDAQAPKLFRLYERLLNRVSRDHNLARARECPDQWRVPGSYAFLQMLHDAGAVNYFITGAVVEETRPGDRAEGMAEEVEALGFEVGPGKLVESLHGSSWSVKRPKREVMEALSHDLNLDPHHVLVVGDGRSEIAAGTSMGAVTLSRLPSDAVRQREVHRALGTHLIVSDYHDKTIHRVLAATTEASDPRCVQ